MIKRLDIKNQQIAEAIVALQKSSYRIEADIIGFDMLPPLLENSEDIKNSKEVYLGYYVENSLAGILSYELEGDALDICKVAVHPSFFKRGIATQLIRFVERNKEISRITVSTGLKNSPAVKLYLTLGFSETHQQEVEPGVHIISFEKLLNKA